MLEEKNIVIVGGTTGLGLSAARKFIELGARVTVTGRNPDSCEKAQKQLGKSGIAISSDATEEGAAEARKGGRRAVDVARRLARHVGRRQVGLDHAVELVHLVLQRLLLPRRRHRLPSLMVKTARSGPRRLQ